MKEIIKKLAEYVVKQQESGKYVPGHFPYSHIYADCSMACDPDCLAMKARKLLKRIEMGDLNDIDK